MENVEQLQKELKYLRAIKGLMGVEGEIAYIHLPEPMGNTDKLCISVGIDCSKFDEFAGESKDFKGVQISEYDKTTFAEFDQRPGNTFRKYKVGDTVEVVLFAGSKAMSVDKKNGSRPIIYNNVQIRKIKLLESAPESAASTSSAASSPAPQTGIKYKLNPDGSRLKDAFGQDVVDDDLPF